MMKRIVVSPIQNIEPEDRFIRKKDIHSALVALGADNCFTKV